MRNSMYTIDFETDKIVNGSKLSPKPVGLSVKCGNEPSKYYAWGHPIENNCTYDDAQSILTVICQSDKKILGHNLKFDLRVAMEYFDLPPIDPSRLIDTMIMAYLLDARESSLSLKPLTEKYCNMPPEEQDELHAWIIRNVPGATKSNAGGYICMAPGRLVGKYAESDTDRTYALYQKFKDKIFVEPNGSHQTITNAFNREMALLPIVIGMEQRGVFIAPNIHDECKRLRDLMSVQDMVLHAYSNGEKPGSKNMFNALRKKGLIDESKLQYTDKGNPKYGKEYIDDLVTDPYLADTLKFRAKLQKILGTYIEPFSESAKKYDGKFYPYYNQTRSENDFGTRTGRFSSNIQQLPKLDGSNTELYGTVDTRLPNVRTFIQPPPGRILIKRDFSGQEVRVMAHYAEGAILKAYKADPTLDPHAFVNDIILHKTGHKLGRTPTKCINFLKIYGGGPANLAGMLKIPLEQARAFFAAYDEAFPEPKQLIKDVEKLARTGKLIRTWGGRSYGVEITPDGRKLYYKLVNILIQGSSADMTKEAMIRFNSHPDRFGNIFMQIHDEIVVETDEDHMHSDMAILKWAMDEIPGWDVPLLSDAKVGYNFGEMEEYND